jgi:thymidylate synthase (FAD)
MKIVKPSVTLIHHTPDPERVIERMGRICYQSQHKVAVCQTCKGGPYQWLAQVNGVKVELPPTPMQCPDCNNTGTDISSAVAFIKMIIANGHESVIEHASAGFLIVTDRGVTHEIVRHRLASYSQESTRYCNYSQDRFGGELCFITPPELGQRTSKIWEESVAGAAADYLTMIEERIPPQIARSVLPNSLKSEIGMTANFREWRHFLRLRTSPKAHPQMRQIAEMIRVELLKISKVCFEDIP